MSDNEEERGLSLAEPKPTERARLEATAVVASRVSREESQIQIKHAVFRARIREGLIVLLVVIVGLLAYHDAGESARNKAAIIKFAQKNCQQLHDGAIVSLSPGSTLTGAQIIAGSRNTYYNFDCFMLRQFGQLGVPDPALVPYLTAPDDPYHRK